MFKFRGQRKDNGEWVVGDLDTTTKNIDYEIWVGKDEWYAVHPNSLSISIPGKPDSTGKEIFASFEIDGQMTTGGDVVDIYPGYSKSKVIYSIEKMAFVALTRSGNHYDFSDDCSSNITIIPQEAQSE